MRRFTAGEDVVVSQLADGGIAVLPVGAIDKQMLIETRRRGDRVDLNRISVLAGL